MAVIVRRRTERSCPASRRAKAYARRVPWFYAVAQRDHDIQNPTSPEKIRWLGELLRLAPTSRVFDAASGRGGPALVLAGTFGCRITAVEQSVEFFDVACERARSAGVDHLIEFVNADARKYPVGRERYDVAMCLGASFVWGGLDATIDALEPSVRAGGHVVVGEPYWRTLPLPDGLPLTDEDRRFTSLRETAARFESRGLAIIGVIDSSGDDWDRYETLNWRACEEWLLQNPGDPDAAEIRALHEPARDRYLSFQRELLGWAIFVALKPG
jgi:SAM-dependent methyltransferase